MMPAPAPHGAARIVRWPRVLMLGLLTLSGVTLLTGLGVWQLERRIWKQALIHRVDARFAAPPQILPMAGRVNAADLEYAHVSLGGSYLQGRDTWVHASTERGAGYWVLSPLRTDQGTIVLINRGFVPLDTPRRSVAEASGHAVIGVLRASEAGGMWPRRNDPPQDRWYSRDVSAIGHARGLADVAPYFIDASADPAAPAVSANEVGAAAPPGSVQPVAGLTVVKFRNTHLSYALTWFCLALMTAAAGILVLRGELLGQAHTR